jgi:hypothetical protein
LPIVDETMMEEPSESSAEADVDSIIANAPTAMLESPDAVEETQVTALLTAPLVEPDAEAQRVPAVIEPVELEAAPIVDEHLVKELSLIVAPAERLDAEPVLPVVVAEGSPPPVAVIEAQTAQAEAAPVVAEVAPSEAVAAMADASIATAEPVVAETPSEPPPAPASVLVRREGSDFLSDAAAPASIESQEAPTGAAEHQARLELARALREMDIHEGTGQYKSLIDEGLLLPDVIADLQGWLKAQPTERVVRVLLADALTKAGRLPEAVEQYRLLV